MTKSSGSDSKNTLYCSFCGKAEREVKKLIAGPTVFICNECVDICADVLGEQQIEPNWVRRAEAIACMRVRIFLRLKALRFFQPPKATSCKSVKINSVAIQFR